MTRKILKTSSTKTHEIYKIWIFQNLILKVLKKQDQNKEEKDYITFDIKEPLDYGMDEMAVRGVRLKIHKSEKMSVIINKYCEQEHLNKDHYKFQLNYQGHTITEEDTPENLKLNLRTEKILEKSAKGSKSKTLIEKGSIQIQEVSARHNRSIDSFKCDECYQMIYFDWKPNQYDEDDIKLGYRIQRKGGKIREKVPEFLKDRGLFYKPNQITMIHDSRVINENSTPSGMYMRTGAIVEVMGGPVRFVARYW